MSNKIKKCGECNEEFEVRYGQKKPGLVTDCFRCGKEREENSGEKRLGGVMIYECKTNGVLQISDMDNVKHFKKRTDRAGQGTPRGMAQRKS